MASFSEKLRKKQEKKEERYIGNLAAYKNELERRIDFLKEYTSPTYVSATSSSGEPTSSTTTDDTVIDVGMSNIHVDQMTVDQLAKANLKGKSGFTAAQLNQWINGLCSSFKCKICGKPSHLIDTGEAFIEAESKGGWRADAMIAQAILESGYGAGSKIVCEKKNFFGYGAFDSSAYVSAYDFNSYTKGIVDCAVQIGKFYVHRQTYKNQPDQNSFYLFQHPPAQISWHKYCSTNNYENMVAKQWAKGLSILGASAPTVRNRNLLSVEEKDEKFDLESFTPFEHPRGGVDENIVIHVPVGQIKGGTFFPPNYERVSYIENRMKSEISSRKEGHLPLPSDAFVHMGGPIENLYTEDARRAFMLLRSRLGYQQLVVARGFSVDTSNSSHSIGIAMDIYVKNLEEALYVADTAYAIGFRAIAIGPQFVHVDVGPSCTWGYEGIPIYRGPGSVKVSDNS